MNQYGEDQKNLNLSYFPAIYHTLFQAVSILKRPITPPATLGMVDYQNADHEQLMKRLRPAQSVEEVILLSCNTEKIRPLFFTTYKLLV